MLRSILGNNVQLPDSVKASLISKYENVAPKAIPKKREEKKDLLTVKKKDRLLEQNAQQKEEQRKAAKLAKEAAALQLKELKKARIEAQKLQRIMALQESKRWRLEEIARKKAAIVTAKLAKKEALALGKPWRREISLDKWSKYSYSKDKNYAHSLKEMLHLLEYGFDCTMPVAGGGVTYFFNNNGFIRARNFIGNFNRGAEIYYREVIPKLFFVFSNHRLSSDQDSAQFAMWVAESDIGTNFFYNILKKRPLSIAHSFSLPDDIPLLQKELNKVRAKIINKR
jgi:hypothetical protein